MPGIDSHPRYTVAFGETVYYNTDTASDAVLALLTSSDDFPALQSSTATGKLDQEDREWQLVHPEDTDVNEVLTTSLDDDGKSEMGSVGWERLDFQKPLSFLDIASRAQDNAPIPHERFFVRPKQPMKPVVKEENSLLPEQEDATSDYCDPFYCLYDTVKEGRRINVTRREFVLRRKRIKIEGVLSRRTRSIPNVVAHHEQRQEKAKILSKEVQEKCNAASSICPYYYRYYNWNYGSPDFGWYRYNQHQQSQPKGTKKTRSKSRAEYLRERTIDELKYHGLFKLPDGKEAITYDDEEQAIQSFMNTAKHTAYSTFLNDIGTRSSYTKPYAYYACVLILLRHYLVPQYQAALKRLDADTGHPGEKSLMRLLYKQLPRKYYNVGNRKHRKQHVHYFMQNHKNSIEV